MTEHEFSDPHTCPRCGGGIPNNEQPGSYIGALSRWDNRTEVCSECGTHEALAQVLALMDGKDPHQVLDPRAGVAPWVVPPPVLT